MTALAPSSAEGRFNRQDPAEEFDTSLQSSSIDQRVTIRRHFEGPATGAGGAVFVIKGPSAGHICDFGSAVLRVQGLSCTMTGGVQPRFMDGPTVGNLISQFIFRINGRVIVQQTDVALYLQLKDQLRGNPSRSANSAWGIGSATDRQAWATQLKSYELPLSLLLPGLDYYPRSFGDFEIELQLVDTVGPLEATGATTAPSWTFDSTRSYLAMDVLSVKSTAALAGFTDLHLEAFKSSRANIPAASTQFDHVAPHRASNLLGVIWCERTAATLATVTTLNRLQNQIVNNKNQAQFEIANVHYPPYQIAFTPGTDSTEAYRFFVVGQSGSKHGGADVVSGALDDLCLTTLSQWEGTHPSGIAHNILAIDLRRADAASNRISGVNTSAVGSDSRLQITYPGAGATAATTANLFSVYEVVLRKVGDSVIMDA